VLRLSYKVEIGTNVSGRQQFFDQAWRCHEAFFAASFFCADCCRGIRLNAYPDRTFTGRINNVGAILDPSLRTAKVRIEVKTPGVMKVGMFVSATLHGLKKETHTTVKASAILHLHDRDWVYVQEGDKQFRRTEVVAGNPLPDGMQEILSGLKPGPQVVTNALVMQNTVEQ
jgi:cobalt-zinc-cadmium efflux system membrane fusion protein